ncbi:hypothetical protein OTK49_02000 [Vibrio coralliirubri]|uniref:hypothetical protein n=1 Tax=Vibrio coralliirubri TaxID=1516159 RepID=UPI0022839FA1|nr:hypothetical protein [Vibrio coralliirubri]MCY9861287.1 hypothetical protein [Vibrio coralliirubri]
MGKQNSLITDVVDVFSSPSVAQEVVVEARSEHHIKRTQQLQYHEIGFKKHNKLFSDGRVYGGYDSEGRYYAVTVSPYFEDFGTQVEKGIQPLVFALKEKGFLTCSSCYGHPLRAMTTVCFPSIDEREAFAKILLDSGIPTIHVNYIDSLVNVGLEEDKNGDLKFTRTLEFDSTVQAHIDMEVESFNRLFFRSHERYYFLQIVLVGDYKWFLNPFKYIQSSRYVGKKDYLINELATLVLSGKTPQQKY